AQAWRISKNDTIYRTPVVLRRMDRYPQCPVPGGQFLAPYTKKPAREIPMPSTGYGLCGWSSQTRTRRRAYWVAAATHLLVSAIICVAGRSARSRCATCWAYEA